MDLILYLNLKSYFAIFLKASFFSILCKQICINFDLNEHTFAIIFVITNDVIVLNRGRKGEA